MPADDFGFGHLPGHRCQQRSVPSNCPDPVEALVACFSDPSIGVASEHQVNRDTTDPVRANIGEKGYAGHEMWVLHLETQVDGNVQREPAHHRSGPETTARHRDNPERQSR